MAVQRKVKPRKEKHKCPPHYFVINSDNVGHCKYCPEVRDFEKLRRKEEHLLEVKSKLARRRSKAIYGYGKRGRKPKYE